MLVLEVGESVIVMPNGFLDDRDSCVGAGADLTKKSQCGVEQTEHIMKTRNGCQMNTVGLEILAHEAGKQMKILRWCRTERRREAGGDLGQAEVVPLRTKPEQGWSDEDLQEMGN